MEGWVDLGSLIVARPGIELTTAWSQVRRPNRYATEWNRRVSPEGNIEYCKFFCFETVYKRYWNIQNVLNIYYILLYTVLVIKYTLSRCLNKFFKIKYLIK